MCVEPKRFDVVDMELVLQVVQELGMDMNKIDWGVVNKALAKKAQLGSFYSTSYISQVDSDLPEEHRRVHAQHVYKDQWRKSQLT